MISLGISCEHDSGAALVVDGKLVAACNEERFTRKKFATEFPIQSIQSIFKTTGISHNQIDDLVIASHMHVPAYRLDWEGNLKFLDATLWLSEKTGATKYILGTDLGNSLTFHGMKQLFNLERSKILKEKLPQLELYQKQRTVNHHLSHAIGAALGSGFDECMVLTLDGSGDALCSVYGYFSKSKGLKVFSRIPFYHSPGHYYLYVTHLFGYPMGREGKVTGMAASGDYRKTKHIFDEHMTYNEDAVRFDNLGSYREIEINHLKKALQGFSREDIAAGLQKNLEEVVVRHLECLNKKYQMSGLPLALSGGVFANVKLNQIVSELPFISEIFVYPHMGDGGLAAGAAWENLLSSPVTANTKLEHCYLGPEAPALTSEDRTRYSELDFKDLNEQELIRSIAESLAKKETVALVRGQMEYGPRALGHRSLLFDACDYSVNDWLNKKLFRSEFMPFAPILKEEYVKDFFHGSQKVARCLPFMTTTLQVTEKCAATYKGVVHKDGTARPQAVSKKTNPFFWKVLDEYEKKTDKKILINTSYNVHEEPIVFDQHHSIKSFLKCELDHLYYNSTHIRRK